VPLFARHYQKQAKIFDDKKAQKCVTFRFETGFIYSLTNSAKTIFTIIFSEQTPKTQNNFL